MEEFIKKNLKSKDIDDDDESSLGKGQQRHGTCSRFNYKSSFVSPGPGKYDPNFNYKYKTVNSFSFKKNFSQESYSSNVPGPGEYKLKGIVDQVKGNVRFSMLERKLLSRDRIIFPGPGKYENQLKPHFSSFRAFQRTKSFLLITILLQVQENME